MPSVCSQIQAQYNQIKALKEEFVSAYEKAKETKTQEDRDKARELQNKLIAQREALKDLLWPFKEMPSQELKKQYEEEVKILKENKLIQEIPNTGKTGIKNHFPELIEQGFPEYFPLPTIENIKKALKEKKELYREKIKQGFARLQITPVTPMRFLIQAAEDALKKRPDILTKDNGTIEEKPIWRWEGLYKYKPGEGQGLDEIGELVYLPKKLDEDNHGGITKQELLKKTLKTHAQGYIIELKQKDPLIPRQGSNIDIAGRKRIEAGKSPENYLKDMQVEQKKPDSKYKGEAFITPDSRIIEFISQIEKGELIGDYQNNKDSACFCLGAYFKSRGYAPRLYWVRDDRLLSLSRDDAGGVGSDDGASASVMVGLETA